MTAPAAVGEECWMRWGYIGLGRRLLRASRNPLVGHTHVPTFGCMPKLSALDNRARTCVVALGNSNHGNSIVDIRLRVLHTLLIVPFLFQFDES